VQSERAQNKDYRYTLMLPERPTTDRMSELLEGSKKPTPKEVNVLQKYARDLLAENDKMARQLDKLQRTGTYTGSGGASQGGSPLMMTGASSASYAPANFNANKDALKRAHTSPLASRGGGGGGGGRGAASSARDDGFYSPSGKAQQRADEGTAAGSRGQPGPGSRRGGSPPGSAAFNQL